MSSLPTIIYVTASGHSGSTLLELLLGSHSALVGTGEVVRLGTQKRAGTCSCGAPRLPRPGSGRRVCPFWSAVFDHVQQNGGPSPLGIDLYGGDLETFVDHNERFYRALAAVSGKRLVVDSSKDLNRLSRLLEAGVFDVRPIVLWRSSAGVAYSNLRLGRPWLAVAVNHTITTMRRTVTTATSNPMRVHYERLATAPQETLADILRWLGLSFEPSQLDWTRHEHHLFAGNDLRFRRDPGIVLDRAWEQGLTSFQRSVIRVVEASLVLPERWWPPIVRAYDIGRGRVKKSPHTG